jgi:urease accessory protein
VIARAHVVAQADDGGRTRLTAVRSEAPLVLRATPDALYLVGGAGGPLGGDDLALDIEVGPGARLTIRTAAASVALPGRGPSTVAVTARVAAGGELQWLPEPLVAARGCDHHMSAVIVVQGDGTLVWREEIVLGRHQELPGSVVTRTQVDLDGAPLLRQELALGASHPAASGPSVTAGARAVGSVLLVGMPWPGGPGAQVLGATAVVLPLAGAGAQVLALAGGASELRRALDAGVGLFDPHPSASVTS